MIRNSWLLVLAASCVLLSAWPSTAGVRKRWAHVPQAVQAEPSIVPRRVGSTAKPVLAVFADIAGSRSTALVGPDLPGLNLMAAVWDDGMVVVAAERDGPSPDMLEGTISQSAVEALRSELLGVVTSVRTRSATVLHVPVVSVCIWNGSGVHELSSTHPISDGEWSENFSNGLVRAARSESTEARWIESADIEYVRFRYAWERSMRVVFEAAARSGLKRSDTVIQFVHG